MKLWLATVLGLWIAPVLAADLEFAQTLKEIDAGPDAGTVTADFEFENRGDEPVTIARYDAPCSCMSITVKGGKLRYEPGEKGVIRGVFDMGNFSGTVDKGMQIWMDGDPEAAPSVRLTVRVNIPVIVEVEPKTLRWDIGEDPSPKTITVTMNFEEAVRVTAVGTGSDRFTTELKVVEEGEKYEIVVTPESTESAGLAVINIATDCPIERHASQRAFSMVRRPVAGAVDK